MDPDASFTYTEGMDRETVERRLREAGTGVLSLADGGDAYGIPVAYHYEDGVVFLRLGETPASAKGDYLDATATATLVVYETDPTDEPRELDSWSILVRGSLREVPGDDSHYDAATINEQFAPIRVFGEGLDELELTLYALEPESVTGRETPEPDE
jgi:nitroimidazol reductase NimA-like FMN-containing flavoprotein (pyridoxamine 5'-phosphate oxidase superfamily)